MPAIVIKSDLSVDLRIALIKLSLEAEVTESTLVQTVLVNTAALVGGTLRIWLVFEASDGTKRTRGTVHPWLDVSDRIIKLFLDSFLLVGNVFLVLGKVVVFCDILNLIIVSVSIRDLVIPFTFDSGI